MELMRWRVYLFGFSLLVSLLLFFFTIFKRGRELYFEEESLFDEVFMILLYGLLGGRISYVLLQWSRFIEAPLSVFNIFGMPGIFYPGLFLGGVVAFLVRSSSKKWDIFVAADILAVGWCLLYALASLSMLIGGVGYGNATETVLGIHFPSVYDKRHPVQIYEFVAYLLAFVWLWKLEDVYRTFIWYKANKSEASSGFIVTMFFLLHGVLGLLFSTLKPPAAVLLSINLQSYFYSGLFFSGLVLLHKRSGKGVGYMLLSFKDSVSSWRK